uniref:NADH-ubiquinone oxidoreductase chain 5 n=1 Tax=Sigara septemlineata TaxID=575837 RepID=C5HIJ2_9HEMI|nr:NADH dehydrogenase subunit 5 [Sigara septemlineata]
MNMMNLYKFYSMMLLLSGLFFFIWGTYFLMIDFMVLVDWEILSINSCSLVFTIMLDYISMIFMGCVLMISSMVIMYSNSYMGGDMYKKRFLLLVMLFVLSMILMIMSPNLISILLGWDGLGLVSYCLVIYFQNFKSFSAGMLTILTNRIGDVAILISISWSMNLGSWNFIYYVYWDSWMAFLLIMLVLAGFTKSAQIPFSSWLPAAMAAPTPVSALVHSSTLVTAGVYLLIRFNNLFMNIDCSFFVFIGMLTMFMSGLGANFEFDLKKIIALSTLSQLGLMMSILFLGFYNVAFFHLLTHAFFKALLFLCAGLIIHCMSNSQDIRHMGGIINKLPFTSTCFCISSMSLCGIPFLSGFYSKDLVLEIYSMEGVSLYIYLIYFISVGLTASYSLRLVYYCLSGYNNLYVCNNYFEDFQMNYPMILLTYLSIVLGSIFMWSFFSTPYLVVLPLHLKVMPILFILVGGWIGYELSQLMLLENFMINYNYINSILGGMWFMPKFSTYMIYGPMLHLSNKYYESMDMGWGEYMMSNSMMIMFSYFSKLNQMVQNNNIKLFLLSFFFIFIFIMI